MQTSNVMPFAHPKVTANSTQQKEYTVQDSVRWMRAELNKALDAAGDSLQRLRLRERVCRAELKDLYHELDRSGRLGLETVTLEVQIQRRLEETSLCRHQAHVMEQHLEALNQRIGRTQQYACVN